MKVSKLRDKVAEEGFSSLSRGEICWLLNMAEKQERAEGQAKIQNCSNCRWNEHLCGGNVEAECKADRYSGWQSESE